MNQKINKVIVHDGMFHADDTMVVAMLKSIYPNIEIIRTRDAQIIKEGLSDPHTIVADVGLGKYDHHQENARIHEDGHKYAAAGLVYEEIKDILFPGDKRTQEDFARKVIYPIERLDNGEAIRDKNGKMETHPVSSYVYEKNPVWGNDKSDAEAFKEANEYLINFVGLIRNTRNIDMSLQVIKDEAANLRQENRENINRGKELVRQIYETSKNPEIIELPSPKLEWKEVLADTHAKFVIYETSTGQINLQAVPPQKDSFSQKVPIPMTFLDAYKPLFKDGEREPFVHTAGFLAALPIKTASTFDGITKDQAIGIMKKEAYLTIEKQMLHQEALASLMAAEYLANSKAPIGECFAELVFYEFLEYGGYQKLFVDRVFDREQDDIVLDNIIENVKKNPYLVFEQGEFPDIKNIARIISDLYFEQKGNCPFISTWCADYYATHYMDTIAELDTSVYDRANIVAKCMDNEEFMLIDETTGICIGTVNGSGYIESMITVEDFMSNYEELTLSEEEFTTLGEDFDVAD